MKKVKRHHLERTYEVKDFENHYEFLEKIARKGGRLLKGGEADMDGVAKMVLNDFLRGKIPWFTPPPAGGEAAAKGETTADGVKKGREGALGEMPGKKRKRAEDDEGDKAVSEAAAVDDASAEDDDEFGGFSEAEGEEDEDSEDVDDEDGDVTGVSLVEAEVTA